MLKRDKTSLVWFPEGKIYDKLYIFIVHSIHAIVAVSLKQGKSLIVLYSWFRKIFQPIWLSMHNLANEIGRNENKVRENRLYKLQVKQGRKWISHFVLKIVKSKILTTILLLQAIKIYTLKNVMFTTNMQMLNNLPFFL
jgi:hypothetical protein